MIANPKAAIHARAAGAGEIKLARLTGSYPVDHDALDVYQLGYEYEIAMFEIRQETEQFNLFFKGAFG